MSLPASNGKTSVPMPSHCFHPSILREYDIRGIVDETLFEADAEWVGRAYASVLARQLKRAAAGASLRAVRAPSSASTFTPLLTGVAVEVMRSLLARTRQVAPREDV